MMNYILNILTIYNSFDLLVLLAVTALKATCLLAFAALLCVVFRRFTAATRHLLWASALCACLLLPLLSFVKGWEISVLPAPITSDLAKNADEPEISKTRIPEDRTVSLETKDGLKEESEVQNNTSSVNEPARTPVSSEPQSSIPKTPVSLWPSLINWALVIWMIGAALLLFRLLTGIISTNRLARQTTEFENPVLTELFSALLTELALKDRIRLRRSERMVMPIVCGIWRSVVILPAAAETWTEERCRMVLLHELTHIARCDCLTQLLAQIACLFYWFNPFMWSAARRLRIEREQACDEYVLRVGTKPSDYARHLLEIARSMPKRRRSVFEWSQTTTVAMAQASQLEERLLAILDKKNKRRAVSHLATASLVLLISVLFLSLAIVHPTPISARNPQNTGMVTDSETPAAGEKSFLDIFLKPGAKSPEKIGGLPAEKKENNASTDENLEKPAENHGSGEQLLQSEETPLAGEQTGQPESVSPLEKTDPNNEPNPTADAKPSPFVNAGYEKEGEPDSPVQEQQEQQLDFIEEMASVGYKNLSIDELINLKSVGVNAVYVRRLRALGIDNLTVRELVNMRAVGVTAEFIEGIRNAGYKEATGKELANLRALGVTPEFIAKFREAGFDNLSIRDLVNLKASGMTLDYVNTMNSLGFGKLSLKELTNMKFQGVTPEFVRKARAQLGNDLTLKQIMGLRNSGILKDKDDE